MTKQRKQLTDFFISNLHESFSAREIHNLLNDDDISLSAIYRNLATMEKEGILCKVTAENSREVYYQYIDPECCSGIIHLICNVCSETKHLNKHISDMIAKIALDDFDFKINEQRAVIYGLCSKCSQMAD